MERFSAGRGSGTRPSAVGGGMAGGGAPSPAESDIRLILSECDRFTGLFFLSLERAIIRNYAFGHGWSPIVLALHKRIASLLSSSSQGKPDEEHVTDQIKIHLRS